jgi:hypothetical protein
MYNCYWNCLNDKHVVCAFLFACDINIMEQVAKIIGLKYLWCFFKFRTILIMVCCTRNYPLSGLYPSFRIPKKSTCMSFQEQIKFSKCCVLSLIWCDGHGQEASNSKWNNLPPLWHVLCSFVRNLISIKHTSYQGLYMYLFVLTLWISLSVITVLTWLLPLLHRWMVHQLFRIYDHPSVHYSI